MEASDVTPTPSLPASPLLSRQPIIPPSSPPRKMAPSITIDKVPNAAALLKTLRNVIKIKLTAKLKGTSLTIFPQTAYAYHMIRRYIDEQQLKAHTYMVPDDKKIHSVIRDITIDMPTEEIVKELSEKSLTDDEIHVMSNKRNGLPMPLFLVTLAKYADKQKKKKKYNVTILGYMEVKVEALSLSLTHKKVWL
ncbi:hypothetical protein NPIL_94731 [Nephila pilipes]|uniref:Pre-C2HC domain-containing protein n=1 Tax=Nephila pilipes TaxID=299642 RepID=A0A8X6UBY1_NEPPI|nr:hypothetical protein NPIL_94731 [Nephila pilipes]